MKNASQGFVFTALAVASSICATSSFAEPDRTGWMVGGGLGTAKLYAKPIDQPALSSSEESATLLTVIGGYNFTPWFGLEFDVSGSEDITDNNTGLDANIFGASISPTFSYQFDDHISVFVKGGLQYIAYEQDIRSRYDNEITWNGIDVFVGAGLQYAFDFGLNIRLDYKFCDVDLDRSENNSSWNIDFYDEEIDFNYRTFSLSTFYQF